MTSPYTPEFEFTDWPNGPLQAHLPGGSSPNVVLNQVEAEFGNVAEAFTGLAAADGALDARLGALDARLETMRGAINALLAGSLPTTPELPVSPGPGDDVPSRTVLVDSTGALVVLWASPRVDNIVQVYASRLDPANPQTGFSPPVAVTSGTVWAGDPAALTLPNGQLVVAYSTGAVSGRMMMKRAALAGLPAAAAQQVVPGNFSAASAHSVLAGGRIVFFSLDWASGGRWNYRRYDHATSTFVDANTVQLSIGRTVVSDGGLHAAAAGNTVWMAYSFRDGDEQPFFHGRRLNAADGTLGGAVDLGFAESKPFVLPLSDAQAMVFHSDANGMRAVTMTATTSTQAVTIPGTGGGEDPAAVRDTDGTIYLFFTRVVNATDTALMLSRRAPTGEWGPSSRISQPGARHRTPQPVLVPGRGVWLVYGSNRTGNVDLYATRIITAI